MTVQVSPVHTTSFKPDPEEVEAGVSNVTLSLAEGQGTMGLEDGIYIDLQICSDS